MRMYASLAAVSAIALLAAETGSGSGSSTPPEGPTPAELKAAEEAREKAVADLAKAKEDAAAVIAEAEKVTKEAADAKAKAIVAKADAEAESKAAAKAKEKAKADKAAADQALKDLEAAQGKLAEAQAAQTSVTITGDLLIDGKALLDPDAHRVIVWAAPGHQLLSVGMLVSVPADEAEALRGRGRARFAADDEIAAAGDDIPQLSGL